MPEIHWEMLFKGFVTGLLLGALVLAFIAAIRQR